MLQNIVQMINQISKEKSIDKGILLEAVTEAISHAAKRKYGENDNVEVEITEGGEIEAYMYRTVVDEIDEELADSQILLEEAQKLDPDLELGDEIAVAIDVDDLGRIAAQTAKQVLVQKLREAERDVIFAEYQQRVGDVVNGNVIRYEKGGDMVVELGRTEAVLPRKEQIPNERFRRGERVRAMIMEVTDDLKGPQVILSRIHPEFLKGLFEYEVPEVYDGIIEIVRAVRDPGERAKILVVSRDPNIDPVGACVGMKGSRVRAVVQELRGERIDIVEFSEESATLLQRAMSPAELTRIVVDEANKQATAIVEEGQQALAIGRRGQNVRLASKLTGYNIDILTEDAYTLLEAQDKARDQVLAELGALSVGELEGVGAQLAADLAALNLGTLREMLDANPRTFTSLPGIEQDEALAVYTKVVQRLDARYEEIKPKPEEILAKPELVNPFASLEEQDEASASGEPLVGSAGEPGTSDTEGSRP
ncbi:MAG: transcription termination factor NusA [Nitrospirota bacterium]